MLLRNQLLIGMTSVACAAMAPAAFSQQTSSSPEGGAGLEEIIVTAQKRAESINDVGLTIQAASVETLEDRGIQGPSDLGKLVSGFTSTESIYSTPVYTLRGIGLYDATFAALSPVPVYTDQVPRNFPVMSAALDLDLERIEVLKGPQGTLFGQSSTGGAVNYITAKPTESFESGFGVSAARFGRYEGSGYVSGPLTDTLGARVAVGFAEGGAWQQSISRSDENGDLHKLAGRLTLAWQPVDQLKIEGSATLATDKSEPQAPQYVASVFNVYSDQALAAANANPATANPYGQVDNALYAGLTTPGSANYDATFLGRQATLVSRMNSGDPRWAPGAQAVLGTRTENDDARAAEWTPGLLGKADNEYYQGTLRADYELNDSLTLTSMTAYAKQDLDYAQDLDGTTAVAVDVPLFGNVKAFNQELRLTGQSDRINWIVGATYDDLKSEQSNFYYLADYSGNEPIPGAPITVTLNDFTSDLETVAGFGNVEFNVTDGLKLTGGLRYTKDKQDASYCYNDPPIDLAQGAATTFSVFQGLFTGQNLPPIQPGECFVLGDGLGGTTFGAPTLTPLERELNQDNWSYRVGANYKFEAGTLLYATVSQGFKTGLFSAIGASSTSQYAPAVQEEVLVYEAGIKLPLADRSVNVNGAVFYYDYKDKQVRGRILDAVYGLLEKMVNVPESSIFGVEAEVLMRPIEGLTLSASATYLDSEVKSSFSETADGSAVYNASGYTGDFEGSPLPFTPELTGNFDAQYEWTLGNYMTFIGGNVLYQDSQNTTFENSVLQADEFEIDSFTTLDLRAGLGSPDGQWKVMLFGRNVTDEVYTTSITTYLDTRFRFTGRPATYGVSLDMKF
jgi:iron complex outermembrane recepter protein